MQTAIDAANRSGEGKKFNPGTLQGDIWYKDVSFRYGTKRPIFGDIIMKVKQGQKIALVGRVVMVRQH